MPHQSKARRGRRLLAAATALALAGGSLLGSLGEASAAPEAVTITPNPATAGAPFQGWGNSLVWFANATGNYPDELRTELYDKVFGPEGLNMNMARYNFGGGRASDVGDYFRPGGAVDGFWAEDSSTDAESLYGELTTNYADRLGLLEAWDPDNPEHYDWSKDSSQRWWLEQLAEQRDDLVLEGFSNSPPYFMTKSGYTSGNTPSSAEQMSTAGNAPEKFAKYILRVAEHLEETYGVSFQSLTPFNEPCNGYWGTPAGREADGITPLPTNSPNLTQEGAQICPGPGEGQQQNLINLLAAELEKSPTLDAVVSANDETNPQKFNTAWKAYDAQTRENVGQINVHTYWDGNAREARDYSRGAEVPLWMSETGGDFVGAGFDPLSMAGGLGLAQKITNDLKLLQPEAYILWQEVEDYYNMQQPRPRGENLNWGSIFIDFDCRHVDADGDEVADEEGAIGFKSMRRVADALADGTPVSEVEDCKIVTNQKFNTMRNFMHFITPGDRLIQTDNTNATAATRGDGTDLSVVYINSSTAEQTVKLDLSGFGAVADNATVTPHVTTQAPAINDLSTALIQGEPVAVGSAETATMTVPAQSVTTFEVDGVSGVAPSAPQLADGQKYQLIGLQSSKALTQGAEGGLVIASPAQDSAGARGQAWIAHEVPLSGLVEGRAAIVLESAADGTFAVIDAEGSALRAYDSLTEAKADPGARWYPTTEDGGKTWTFSNGFNGNVLEVGGGSTAENAPVGWWVNTYSANQRWLVNGVSEAPTVEPISVHTELGMAPVLPTTVVPVYSWGEGVAVPVHWQVPHASFWDTPGTVHVTGTATDLFGNAISGVAAVVEVGPLTHADPASVKVLAGSSVEKLAARVPDTVAAQAGAGSSRFQTPVEWDLSALTDAQLAEPGVLTVHGVISSEVSGADPIRTVLYVIVAEASGSELLDVGCTASATFTEPGYDVARTCNGNLTDKAWSNWRSGDKNSQDTLTYEFDEAETVRTTTVHFYKDGSDMSFPAEFQTQYRAPGSDVWTDVGSSVTVPDSATSPVVEVDLGDVTAAAVRIVLTARPSTHMIVSEVQFHAPAAGPVSTNDLARLTVNGLDIDGFDPEVLDYTVPVLGSNSEIHAVPIDADAEVAIRQVDDHVTITVTATDGSQKTYTLTLRRQVHLQSLTIEGEPVEGKALTAVVVSDPEATLSYQWLRNGDAIAGATQRSYTPGADDVDEAVSVRVAAEAPGFRAAERTSAAVVIIGIEEPTTPPTTEPAPTEPPTDFEYVRTAPYTLPGPHLNLNGRNWNTKCEPYSQTERCRTDIWATVVLIKDGKFVRTTGWTFNNLTYLPFMTKEAWGANPLANAGEWTATSDGRRWRTECGTPATGRDGCRSYASVTVYKATAKPGGGYVFSQNNEWVVNNIVMFGDPSWR
ncbi:Ig-like domain-containing protein [Tessaracoccus sp. Y36]